MTREVGVREALQSLKSLSRLAEVYDGRVYQGGSIIKSCVRRCKCPVKLLYINDEIRPRNASPAEGKSE